MSGENPVSLVTNQSIEAATTALNIYVAEGKAPLKVNASAGTATNLSADNIDGKDSSELLGKTEKAQDSNNLDGKAASAFLGRTEQAADSAKLGGQPAADYLRKCQNATVYGRADIRGSDATSAYSTTGVSDLTDFVCTGEHVQVQRVSAGPYGVVFGDVNHGGTVGLGTGNGPLPVVSPREAGEIVEAYGPAKCAGSTTYATTCFPVQVTNFSSTSVDGDFIIASM